MDKQIGIGLLIGVVATTSIYIWNSKRFSQTQKTILLICIVFPPAQWILAITFLVFNSQSSNVNIEKNREDVKQYENLTRLKEIGVLTDKEFDNKAKEIYKNQLNKVLYNSSEYKSLLEFKENGILTEQEFEAKIQLLKERFTENEFHVNTTNHNVKSNNKASTNNKPLTFVSFFGTFSDKSTEVTLYPNRTFSMKSHLLDEEISGNWKIHNDLDFIFFTNDLSIDGKGQSDNSIDIVINGKLIKLKKI